MEPTTQSSTQPTEPVQSIQSNQTVPSQSSSKLPLIIISLLFIGALASTAYFYYKTIQYEIALSQQKTETLTALIEAKKNLTAAVASSTLTENAFHKISIKDVHIGDVFNGLTVKDVKYNMQPTNDSKGEYLSSANITFSGNMFISGKVWWSDMFQQSCVSVDEKDIYKIPRFKEDGRDSSFCFSNKQNTLPATFYDLQRTSPKEGLPLTFEISNYKVQLSEKESSDIATFVRVVQ